ncbi:hypothetical protein EFQ99_31525 [Rhizobium vallis]|uniref:Uncharacterized protein n=1 Tax=Rhizobium vallis TaxID=634290 RepID=A0A432PB68_9HYPH|nr:hypothetical protein EFQ99_31525 [Rhizobium vallis]
MDLFGLIAQCSMALMVNLRRLTELGELGAKGRLSGPGVTPLVWEKRSICESFLLLRQLVGQNGGSRMMSIL